MATLEQLANYSQVAADLLAKLEEFQEVTASLGSDPLGVLSAINLEVILAQPVANKLPVYPQLDGVEAIAKRKRERRAVTPPPIRLPDLDLPAPREEVTSFEPEPEVEQPEGEVVVDPVVTKVEQPVRPAGDESYELRGPERKSRNLAETAPGEPPITKPTQKALMFLYEYLQENGPTPRLVVADAAKAKGISEFALKEARRYTDDIKVKIVGLRGLHWLYLNGQEDDLPSANGEAKAVKESVESGRGPNPDEVSVLAHTPGSIAEIIGRTGLHPQKVKASLEFLQRTKRVMLDKGANVWRPIEPSKV